ncbi:MAG: hypothetical protein ABL982_10510, partial [Vicinamibacterales bacterium]
MASDNGIAQWLATKGWRMINPARPDRGPGAVLVTKTPDSLVAGWIPVPSSTAVPSLLLKEWSTEESFHAGSDVLLALPGGADLNLALERLGVQQYRVVFGDATIQATTVVQLQRQVAELKPDLTEYLSSGAEVVVEALTVGSASIEVSERSSRESRISASMLADAVHGQLAIVPRSETCFTISVKEPVVIGVRTTPLRTTDSASQEQLRQAYEHVDRLLSPDDQMASPGLAADGASPVTQDPSKLTEAEQE